VDKARVGDTVQVHYRGKLSDGTVFDSSSDGDPLQITLGDGSVIPGFERAIVGMSPGDTKTEQIPCELAYGPYRNELAVEVDPAIFRSQEVTPKVGLQLQVTASDGRELPVVVTEVSDSSVRLDANHPLAGQDLIFDIDLVEIM
jgi:peptidylprolyl isomerase